jgi:hypothetical protein
VDRLFKADDVSKLAERHGIVIATNAKTHDDLAYALHEAFDYAIHSARFQNAKSSPSKVVEWFKDIETKAAALLNAMGFEEGNATLQKYDLEFPICPQAIQNLKDGVFMNEGLLPQYMLLPEQVREALNNGGKGPSLNDIMNGSFEAPPGADLSRHLMSMSRLAACSLLSASPWIIALIAEIGRLQAEFYGESITKGGDRKNAFSRSLFMHLYDVYQNMTGAPPKLRVDRERDPNAPAVKWSKEVCILALERAPGVFRPIYKNELDAIRAVTGLRDTTVLEHLEAGQRAWKAWQKAVLHKD